MALVALEDLECYQVNVNNVFTKSFLKKTIYIASSFKVKITQEQVLHILCSLYSLKQVTRDWHWWCADELIKMKLHASDADVCLFIHSKRDIMFLLYVNNIVLAAKSLAAVKWFKNSLVTVFKIKNLRKTQKILNIQIIHDCNQKTLHMNQSHYVNKILRNIHIWSDKHKHTKISLNEYDVLCLTDFNNQWIN